MTNDTIDALLNSVTFNEDGLVPAIAQAHDSGEVLMLAWMNGDALRKTMQTGKVTYWSRSRKQLWTKGETSGQMQHLKEIHVDCDGDTLLLKVEQKGVACHTGRPTCFFQKWENGSLRITQEPLVDPKKLYGAD